MSGTPLTNAKAAADFAGKILNANPENRVAVVSYTHWAEINQGLTGSFDSVSNAINYLSPGREQISMTVFGRPGRPSRAAALTGRKSTSY